MPKVIIDDVEYEAKDGQTIIEVADEHGINIPRFCYHPGLTVAGNCRICLVEVEKAPKPMIACGTPVMDGMVVKTQSKLARWSRQGVMEFLLLNHPLDCPICDKAGECMLQWYSVEHGPGRSRLVEEKNHFDKRVDIGEHIILDQERCILCSRCVRFCDEITGTSELGIFQRSSDAVLNVVPGKRLDNHYSGCVTDICPVGALTLKEFRFGARVWFLEDTATICPGCSRGCNVNVSVRDNEIARLLPRTNTNVNDYWMCDTGRLIYQELSERGRMETPQVLDAGALQRAPWDRTAHAAWKLLHQTAERYGHGAVAAVASARATNEEIYLLRCLMNDLDGAEIAFPEHVQGEDDGILLNADRTPNQRGAAVLCGDEAVDGSALQRIRAGIERGQVRALLVLDEDLPALEGWTDVPLERLDALVVMGTFELPQLLKRAQAQAVLPLAAWAEIDGTYVNFQGRVQRLRAAVRTAGEARPGWRVLADLRALAGHEERYRSARDVMHEMSATVPAFQGLTYPSIGEGGLPLPDAQPSGAPEAEPAPDGGVKEPA
ncbi:MAG: 2Fe-2S iron-sulfur cluster-binding protein [Planctomycetota bacterium]